MFLFILNICKSVFLEDNWDPWLVKNKNVNLKLRIKGNRRKNNLDKSTAAEIIVF